MKTRKNIFCLVTIVVFVTLSAVNIFAIDSSYEALFLKLNASVFEPILALTTSVMIASVILVMFSSAVYDIWFKRFFIWFVPIALILTFSTSSYGSFTFPDRTAMAMLCGEILVVGTLVFALVQKYYYKR